MTGMVFFNTVGEEVGKGEDGRVGQWQRRAPPGRAGRPCLADPGAGEQEVLLGREGEPEGECT